MVVGTPYLVAAAFVAILVLSILRSSMRPANFPPGPLGLPIVGYLPFLDSRNVGRSFRLLSERYGSIFSIMVGTKPLVVLNSYKLIKEALSKAEFSGRPNMFSGTFFQKGKTGVCTTEGSTWESQRSFLHSQMAQFASSKAFQEVVMDEIDDMKLELTKKVGEPVGLAYYLNVSLINCLWTIVSGRRLHAQQQEFQSVYECIDKINHFMSRAAIMSFVPLLSKVLPESISKMARGRYYRNRFVAISEKWIREHKQDYRGNRTGDLQDMYLAKMKAEDCNNCSGFNEANLGAMLREIFVLGSESVSVMLRWSFRVLSVNKDVQRLVQDEIDRVVGDRCVEWEDRFSMNYTLATLSELQRFADIAPSGIPHKVVCDVKLEGFDLPKGTSVLANLHACHRDPEHWTHPDQFYPEHFLDEQGEYIKDKEGFVPYGTGMRKCPADELAQMETFLILTNLLQAFSFRTPSGDNGKIGTYYKAGTSVLRNPKPFYVVLQNRKSGLFFE